MHLLSTSSTSLDDIVEPVDLGQPPGDIAILSFADSDLAGLAAAWAIERDALPSVRLVQLRDLKHPMSVDLWIERVARHAKVIVVRLLGGLDWWRYGVDRLSALAREQGIALAVLPGEDRDDPRLAEISTLPADELAALLRYFREGGRDNLRALLRRLARHAGAALDCAAPRVVPRTGGYTPEEQAVDLDRLLSTLPQGRPVIPIVFYRSMLLAADVAPIDALCEALAARGLAPAPLFVTSLKDAESAAFLRAAMPRLRAGADRHHDGLRCGGRCGRARRRSTRLAFRCCKPSSPPPSAPPGPIARAGSALPTLPCMSCCPNWTAVCSRAPLRSRAHRICWTAWRSPASPTSPSRTGSTPSRIGSRRWCTCRRRRASKRRIAVLMPDYPGAPGRTGYAVGLDVPASVNALLADLAEAGYAVADTPPSSKALLDALAGGGCLDADRDPIAIFCRHFRWTVSEKIWAAWGAPEDDPDVQDGAFRFRAQQFGNVIVALPPDRGRPNSRRADYHDPSLPPRHALLAFGLWLRHIAGVDAIVHMGAHGTLEWLPGKAVALTAACFPEAVVGPLPVIYPFIVSNPGEAAQAKRRIAAVTLGHLPPPLVGADLSGDARELERLVDEYAQADGLDRRRRERLAQLIVESRATQRLGARGRRRRAGRFRRGAAPHRRLALRSEGPRHQGRPAHLRPRPPVGRPARGRRAWTTNAAA